MIRIDLLPKEERVRKRVRRVKPRKKVHIAAGLGLWVVIVCTAAFVIIAVLIHMFQYREAHRLSSELVQMRQELRSLDREVQMVRRYAEDEKRIKERIEIIRTLNKDRYLQAHLLDEVSKALPEHTWLTELSDVNGRVTIKGKTISNMIVAEFMNRLGSSPYLNTIDLILLKKETLLGHDVIAFELAGQAVGG